jgi:hypothetical protein
MANKINREVRIRFSDKEIELFNYITSKRSAAGFLKDIAAVEMKRENNLINNTNEIAIEMLKLLLQNNNLNIKVKDEQDAINRDTDFNSNIEDEFDD